MATTGELEVQFKSLERRVDNHDHTLYGNGDKGIKSRMQTIEEYVEAQIAKSDKNDSEQRRLRYTVMGAIIIAGIMWLGGLVKDYAAQAAADRSLEQAASRIERSMGFVDGPVAASTAP